MALVNPVVQRWVQEARNDPDGFWGRAVIGELNFLNMLPKTRSGKIMRRVLKAVTADRDPGDITTIEDEGSVEDARHAWTEMKQDLAAQAVS